MFRAGPRGYICKATSMEEIARALREVYEGKVYFDPSISSVVLEALTETPIPIEPPRNVDLSHREQTILSHLAHSKSMTEITASLGVAEKTLYKHRKRLMEKLSIESFSGLVAYAVRYASTLKDDVRDVKPGDR